MDGFYLTIGLCLVSTALIVAMFAWCPRLDDSARSYALVIELSDIDCGLENGVYFVGSFEKAVDFAVETLVQCGQMAIDPDGRVRIRETGRAYDWRDNALQDWQLGTLSAFDRFHVQRCMSPDESPVAVSMRKEFTRTSTRTYAVVPQHVWEG
tara:strand:- start:202 stop:660 length:459 start_codon:yes stop_codon:yes gene_type:complete